MKNKITDSSYMESDKKSITDRCEYFGKNTLPRVSEKKDNSEISIFTHHTKNQKNDISKRNFNDTINLEQAELKISKAQSYHDLFDIRRNNLLKRKRLGKIKNDTKMLSNLPNEEINPVVKYENQTNINKICLRKLCFDNHDGVKSQSIEDQLYSDKTHKINKKKTVLKKINNKKNKTENEKNKIKKQINDPSNKNKIFRIKKDYVINYNAEDIITVDNKTLYRCKICNKKYKNYSALYAHRRNKHNLIEIKGIERIFESIKKDNNSLKFDYNSIAPKKKIKKSFTKKLIDITKKNMEVLYKKTPNSCLNNPNFEIHKHPFIICLEKFQEIFSKNLLYLKNLPIQKILEKFSNLKSRFGHEFEDYFNSFNNFNSKKDYFNFNDNDFLTIDDIFAAYFILLSRIIKSFPKIYVEEINKFFLLFREFLNLTGWEYLEKFKRYKLEFYENEENFEFTQFNFIRYIPDFIEKFVTVFLKIPDFQLTFDTLFYSGIALNFCKYINNENLTNLKTEDWNEKNDSLE